MGFKLQKTDMSKLRAKQRRASKGVSEYQHFSDPKSQGDEPRVEYNMKSAAPFKMKGWSPFTKIDIGKKLKEKYKGTPQTTDVEGKKIVPTSKYGPNIHKGHDDEDLRGNLVKGTSPKHKYKLKENLTQAERSRLLQDPDYNK